MLKSTSFRISATTACISSLLGSGLAFLLGFSFTAASKIDIQYYRRQKNIADPNNWWMKYLLIYKFSLYKIKNFSGAMSFKSCNKIGGYQYITLLGRNPELANYMVQYVISYSRPSKEWQHLLFANYVSTPQSC